MKAKNSFGAVRREQNRAHSWICIRVGNRRASDVPLRSIMHMAPCLQVEAEGTHGVREGRQALEQSQQLSARYRYSRVRAGSQMFI